MDEQRLAGRRRSSDPRPAGSRSRSIGIAATYGLIAGLLAVSTLCILLIARKPMPEPTRGETMIQSLLGGIRYVMRTPALIGSMALDLFAVFFGGAIALLPVFASDILHVGPVGLGCMRTAPSVGALLVMLVATRRPPGRHAGRSLLVCVAGFGLSMIVFGLSTDVRPVARGPVLQRGHRRGQHDHPEHDPAGPLARGDPGSSRRRSTGSSSVPRTSSGRSRAESPPGCSGPSRRRRRGRADPGDRRGRRRSCVPSLRRFDLDRATLAGPVSAAPAA